MNYYEELGLRPDAAPEEIRQAYKMLARLLHPDAQPDARLKAMAECQMRRLNEIQAILTDTLRRRQYDESLSSSPAVLPAPDWTPPPPPVAPAYWYRFLYFGLRHWFWILIGLVVVGVGLWCTQQGAPESVQVVPMQSAAAPDAPAAQEQLVGVKRRESTGAAIKPAPPGAASSAPREPARPDARQAAVRDEPPAKPNPPEPARIPIDNRPPPPNAIAVAEVPRGAPEPAKAETPSTIAGLHELSFAGNWFYAPETAAKMDPNLYPATSVEFILAEENGNLVGDYRAKYRVPDQAISSEVQFRVQGKSSNGKSCRLTWTSDDGAQGEAELKLSASNRMNVTWWTTVFGRRVALSSGMAVLSRQQAP